MNTPINVKALVVAVIIAALLGVNWYQYTQNQVLSAAIDKSFTYEVSPTVLTEKHRAIVRDFHRLVYPRTPSTHWLGIQTLQNPFDMWIQQEILTEVKPDFVVECGAFKGGSALIWSMLFDQLNPDGRVISIDIEDNTAEAAKLEAWKRVDFIHGSSTDPKIVEAVTQKVKGKKVVVMLDSDHTRDHVLAELNAYAPLVSLDSYLIVQDTDIGEIVRLEHGPGPMAALDAFLKVNDQFVSDRERERLLFTNHPRGYLKRVKRLPS